MRPISVCMIAKNEEEILAKTLEPLSAFVKALPGGSELLLTDTGSKDSTKDIAASFGARITEFSWIGDFSAARNFCMQQAANDLVLFLDCDEVPVETDPLTFCSLSDQQANAVGLILRDNHFFERDGTPGIYTDRVPRLFHRRLYHYEGRIHEQVAAKNGKPYKVYELPFRTDHGGYAGSREKMEAKTKHYASLLKEELAEKPDDPYLYFQLGQCYNTLYLDEEALSWYEQALRYPLDPGAEYVEMLMNAIGHCLLHLDRLEEAQSFIDKYYDAYFHCSDLFCLAGSVKMRRGELVQAMLEYIKAITAPTHHREGTDSYIPYFNIAYMYEAMGKTDLAIENYKKCGTYPPALEKLKVLSLP